MIAWFALLLALLAPVVYFSANRLNASRFAGDEREMLTRARGAWALALGAEVLALTLSLLVSAKRRKEESTPSPQVAGIAAVIAIIFGLLIGFAFRPEM